MARQISVQSPARISFFRPVALTASTTRWSCQVLMKVRSIGFCSGNTSWMPWMSRPPRSSRTVVRMVGTPKALAALASPTTLLTTIVGSWLFRLANWNGWWSISTRTLSSGVSSASSPALFGVLTVLTVLMGVSLLEPYAMWLTCHPH